MLLTGSKECGKVTKGIFGEQKIKIGVNNNNKKIQLIWQTGGDSLFLKKMKSIEQHKRITAEVKLTQKSFIIRLMNSYF